MLEECHPTATVAAARPAKLFGFVVSMSRVLWCFIFILLLLVTNTGPISSGVEAVDDGIRCRDQ